MAHRPATWGPPSEAWSTLAHYSPVQSGQVASSTAPPSPSLPVGHWKRQVRELGVATCVHGGCRLNFLSIAGIVAHSKACHGFVNPGDFVSCQVCGLRFKQYKSMQTHRDRAHFVPAEGGPAGGGTSLVLKEVQQYGFGPHTTLYVAQSAPATLTYRGPAAEAKIEEDSSVSYLPPEIARAVLAPKPSEAGDERQKAAMAARLMAESRLISTPKPVGRPAKYLNRANDYHVKASESSQYRENLQCRDPFDIQSHPPLTPERSYPEPAEGVAASPSSSHPRLMTIHKSEPQPFLGYQSVTIERQNATPMRQTQLKPIFIEPAAEGGDSHHVYQVSSADSSSQPYRVINVSTASSPSPHRILYANGNVTITPQPPAATPSLASSYASAATTTHPPPQVVASESPATCSSPAPPTPPIKRAPASPTASGPLTDMDLRERELEEEEAKLAEYERIVLQSEELAQAARQKKIQERQERNRLRKEALQKRLQEAVSVIEATKEPKLEAEPPEATLIETSHAPSSPAEPCPTPEDTSPSPGATLETREPTPDPSTAAKLAGISPEPTLTPDPVVTKVENDTPRRYPIEIITTRHDPNGSVQTITEMSEIIHSDGLTLGPGMKILEIPTSGFTETVVMSSLAVPPQSGNNEATLTEEAATDSNEPPQAIDDEKSSAPESEDESCEPALLASPEEPMPAPLASPEEPMPAPLASPKEPVPEPMEASSEDVDPFPHDDELEAPTPDVIISQEDSDSGVKSGLEDLIEETSSSSICDLRANESDLISDPKSDVEPSKPVDQPPLVCEEAKTLSSRADEKVDDEAVELVIDTTSDEVEAAPVEVPEPTEAREAITAELRSTPDVKVGSKSKSKAITQLKEAPKKRGRPRKAPSTASLPPIVEAPVLEPRRATGRRAKVKEEVIPEKVEPIKTTRRGRKRLPSVEAMPPLPAPPAKRGRIKKEVEVMKCGKCETEFHYNRQFIVHAAIEHGTLARLQGQSQEFTPEERDESLRIAFKNAPKVKCFQCPRIFSSLPGLHYHLRTCQKTVSEIEAQKVKCPLCPYKGFPGNMKQHEARHQNRGPSKKERKVEEVVLDGITNSGRKRRRAAAKASDKVNAAIKMLKSKEDGELSDLEKDEDDEAFSVAKAVDLKAHYEATKDPLSFSCKLCPSVFEARGKVEVHLLEKHSDEIGGDPDDEDEGFPEEDEASEADSMGDESEDGEKKYRRTSFIRYRSRMDKPSVLVATTDVVAQEAAYRKVNFEQCDFEAFHTTRGDWVQVDEAHLHGYLPEESRSVPFNTKHCSSSKEIRDHIRLGRFNSIQEPSSVTMFTGGPIWASDWCPITDPNYPWALLALATHKSMDDRHARLSDTQPSRGLIQVWRIHKSSFKAEMILGIAHDFGLVLDLKWAPSGNQRSSAHPAHLKRLGVLAAAGSDGAIRVYSVCDPEGQLTISKVYQPKPSLILTMDYGANPDLRTTCVKLAWFRGRKHRVIAGGFSDGRFALWDILQPCDSLYRREDKLYPYLHNIAHTAGITDLDLGDHSSDAELDFPKELATGSYDRGIFIWDLDHPASPIQSVRKGLVKAVNWLRHHPGEVMASFDDVFLQSHTQSVVFDFSSANAKAHPIMTHNSAVWSQSVNPWTNVLATSTSAGEVVLFVGAPMSRSLENDKDTNRRRIYLYTTSSTSEAELSDVKDNNNFAEVAPERLEFVDVAGKDVQSVPIEMQKKTRYFDGLQTEDITRYPLKSINQVRQNLDPHAQGLVFTGSQSGLARVHLVEFLLNAEVTAALKTASTEK